VSSGIGVEQPEHSGATYPPGASVLVLASSQKQPYGTAADETHVYWATWGSDDASDATVMKVSKGGGALTTLASGYKWIGGIALSASTVYFTGGYLTGGGLFGVGLDGGAVTSLSSTFINDNIAVGPSGVYGTDSSDSLVGVGLDGGPTVTLSTGPGDSNTYGIAADATNVYWTNFANPATLQKVPVHGGPSVTLAPTKVAFGVALDATNVYWADAGDGTVRKVPIGGGAVKVLASGLSGPTNLAVDATTVYVTTGTQGGNGDGSIVKFPIEGGNATTLVAHENNPSGIAVDETSVYWTTLEGACSRVMKLTPK
jgi:hypothetical protein